MYVCWGKGYTGKYAIFLFSDYSIYINPYSCSNPADRHQQPQSLQRPWPHTISRFPGSATWAGLSRRHTAVLRALTIPQEVTLGRRSSQEGGWLPLRPHPQWWVWPGVAQGSLFCWGSCFERPRRWFLERELSKFNVNLLSKIDLMEVTVWGSSTLWSFPPGLEGNTEVISNPKCRWKGPALRINQRHTMKPQTR